ncbi:MULTISPECIES: DMT family transporter [Vibrio]|uniref:DMT family transporter n=1 Tax=Vibrio neptunius TaxID=170651 RepID=A0ABS3A554_9VIBR|nr:MULTISPECIES: DMT family transporter [Vibrio]MBN3494491.1 DMT family transporter [Vibrio neptunius]MBN3516952.1 DMT family transporter [Vibrio neptunius]MBN3551336.1 DMT family transporter [Vibrio neptunius]MBN3579349.1 DMT family transporter [Vibrio neptunius]MCH9873013.1 DMT family transporter [Vibrio neptunius]
MNKGVALAIFSALIFSIMNALIKAASLTIPSAEIVFFRSAIGTILILGLMWQAKVAFSTVGVPLLVLRGLLGAFYLLAFVYTITHIPLADAAILAYLSPFFVIVLSSLVLGERLPDKARWLLPLVMFGVALVINPFDYTSFNVFALAGIASALFAAGASITIRHLSKRHHTYEIVFYFLMTAMLVSAYLMKDDFVVPQGIEWVYLVAIGVVSLIGQIFLTKAFTHENAAVVAGTRYIGLVFNVLWGVLFWQEIPSWMTILGGGIIVVACIALSWKTSSSPAAQPQSAKS